MNPTSQSAGPALSWPHGPSPCLLGMGSHLEHRHDCCWEGVEVGGGRPFVEIKPEMVGLGSKKLFPEHPGSWGKEEPSPLPADLDMWGVPMAGGRWMGPRAPMGGTY